MKNLSFYFLFFLTTLFICSQTVQAVASADHDHNNCSQNKVYVQPEDIFINEAGIFRMVETGVTPIQGVYSDRNGIYVIPDVEASYCYDETHGRKCHYCEGCFQRGCLKRCNCN